jgi:endoglucanase
LGVNRSGTQYMCYDGGEFFDGPGDDASIQAMAAWGITAVRVNLNEHCWLGLSDVPSGYGGEAYRKVIGDFVDRLTAHGLYVIVDMHHSGPGLNSASGQQPMADRDHAVAFWSSVAEYFKANRAVLFDLFNEPYPDNNQNTTAAWTCVRDGGTCPGVGFVTEGMQQMLDAVRATGATNPVLISGPEYAGTLDRWLEFKPNDPLNQLVASVHIYGQPLGSPYDDPATWEAQIAPLAGQVPLVMGEIGDTDCTHQLVDRLMAWADAQGISYLAWSWIVGDCAGEPSLITDYNGTPSQYGVGVRDHLLSLPR